ncbi:mitochondrial 37S ribosomal protein uS13m SWS2 [Sporobolomyces koalae]|uniref:mitochondrial 37S ribosomal protein uS13m SWS2 n=1 Tax=Sporobolomyces koalae TaxID=500713 RepID=UPI00316BFB5A
MREGKWTACRTSRVSARQLYISLPRYTRRQIHRDLRMVNLLGATLPDRKLVKIALLAFHGINHRTSSRIMARLQFHDQMRVSDLTEPQMNALSALLSAPAAAPRPSTPLLPFSPSSSTPSTPSTSQLTPRDPPPTVEDPIPALLIEEDLRRARRADIAHHRTVGTLKGRQHAMGLPVRGQRNKTNAKTAKKLNRIERRGFATSTNGSPHGNSASLGRSSVLDNLRSLHSALGRPSLSSVFRA